MGIIRRLSPEEKDDGKELGDVSTSDIFLSRLAEYEQEFVEAQKPFCTPCAMAEFDMKRQEIKIRERLKTGIDISDDDPVFIKLAQDFDLSAYGQTNYFNLIGEVLKTEKKLAGTNTWVDILIVEKNYACKKYNHGRTVSVPKEELKGPISEKTAAQIPEPVTMPGVKK